MFVNYAELLLNKLWVNEEITTALIFEWKKCDIDAYRILHLE